MSETPTTDNTAEQTTSQVQEAPVTATDTAQVPSAERPATRPRFTRTQCAC